LLTLEGWLPTDGFAEREGRRLRAFRLTHHAKSSRQWAKRVGVLNEIRATAAHRPRIPKGAVLPLVIECFYCRQWAEVPTLTIAPV
jgi:hypothetical protein